jgi:hypothetical protein
VALEDVTSSWQRTAGAGDAAFGYLLGRSTFRCATHPIELILNILMLAIIFFSLPDHDLSERTGDFRRPESLPKAKPP